MALKGLRVVELAGLAPGPYCGMILADFGAKVIRVDKIGANLTETLSRGKISIAANLKTDEGRQIVRKLTNTADVLIEPFRAGVMEKLGLGPDVLMKDNPRLIYARMTGFGQYGSLANRAGHDINYISIAGALSTIGRRGEKPIFPINLLGDFAGGGLICALGVMMALYERTKSGLGQVIDANMVEGAAYVSSFLWDTKNVGIWGEERGTGILDTGAHFYETYRTSDGKFMSVGAIEPQFYDELLTGLGVSHEEAPQFGQFTEMKEKFKNIFATKTRNEWTKIFEDKDACVMPILERDEAPYHKHNVERGAFIKDADDGQFQPKPAPNLSRTPATNTFLPKPAVGGSTIEILKELGYSDNKIKELIEVGAVQEGSVSSKL